MNFNAPTLFNDHEIDAKNYPEDLLPDLLWAASPNDLRNATESDALSYQWDEVTDPEKIAHIVAEGRPHIVLGSLVFVGSELVRKAA